MSAHNNPLMMIAMCIVQYTKKSSPLHRRCHIVRLSAPIWHSKPLMTHFNRELFGGLLCDCMITLPRRNRRTLGYFWAQRFVEIGGTDRTDEIALNPQHFLHQPMRETLSTLVHEMVHLWQQHHGKSGRGRYHNREWAEKMKQVGPVSIQYGQTRRQRSGPADDALCHRGRCLRRCLRSAGLGRIPDHLG